jgi:MYXO-CTERM domain-containing protein
VPRRLGPTRSGRVNSLVEICRTLYDRPVRRSIPLLILLLLAPRAADADGTLLRFPAEDPQGELFMSRLMVLTDHDLTPGKASTSCVTFDGRGFPWCYAYHDGSDFLLMWGLATMDLGVKIVAAADGEVIDTVDGYYDRCHGVDGSDVSCDGNPMGANGVELRHADGLVTGYWHMKKGSVQVKTGDKVTCGQVLGLAGSSGKSAMPHLHFDLRSKEGAVLDPFAGAQSQPQSYWTLQQGPFGWPGDHCQGRPYLEAPSDGGVRIDGVRLGDGSPASGCAVAGSVADGVWALPLLVLGALISWRRARHGAR